MTTDLTPTITDDEVRELPLAGARADLLRELLAETGAAAEPVRRPRRWLLPLAAAAAVLAVGVPVAITQLTGDDGPRSPGVATDPTAAPQPAVPAAFQIRPVSLTSHDPISDDPERGLVEEYVCPMRPVAEAPEVEELACNEEGTVRYLLGAAAVEDGIVSAEAVAPAGQPGWTVVVQLDDDAAAGLADLTYEVARTDGRIALVLDGAVLSAPTVNGVITTGQLQLSGDFSREDAELLAYRLTRQP